MKRAWIIAGVVAVASVALVAAALWSRTSAERSATSAAPSVASVGGESTTTQSAAPPSSASSVTTSGAQRSTPTAPSSPGAPTLAKQGAALVKVPSPPSHTIRMLGATTATAGDVYAVQFSVYGYGPGQRTVVARISKSTPPKKSKNSFDFNGRNVVLAAGSGVEVIKGGTYAGRMRLDPQSDGLLMVLVSAKPTK